ncbi:MAG: PilZ domain-containing protein [Thiogranum sp.]|jgi:hypothetical protein
MDHRYSVRLPLHLTVEVFKQERLLGRYIARNMDVEGVFIEMRTTDLEANDVVKLIFHVPDCERCDFSLSAGVVRVDADGAGMMLFDPDHKAPDILRAAELSDQVPGRRDREGGEGYRGLRISRSRTVERACNG